MTERKIKSKSTYTISLVQYEDGFSSLDRTNDGFDALQLLGLIHLAQSEIINQITGKMPQPDVVNCRVVNND